MCTGHVRECLLFLIGNTASTVGVDGAVEEAGGARALDGVHGENVRTHKAERAGGLLALGTRAALRESGLCTVERLGKSQGLRLGRAKADVLAHVAVVEAHRGP